MSVAVAAVEVQHDTGGKALHLPGRGRFRGIEAWDLPRADAQRPIEGVIQPSRHLIVFCLGGMNSASGPRSRAPQFREPLRPWRGKGRCSSKLPRNKVPSRQEVFHFTPFSCVGRTSVSNASAGRTASPTTAAAKQLDPPPPPR